MKRKGKRIVLAFINLLAYLGTITVNALANALPINGNTTGALSDAYPNLFVPAGLTFSIWGLIYLLLGVFAVYQLASAFRRSEDLSAFIDRISVFFILSCIANAGWVFAWHYEYVGISLIFLNAIKTKTGVSWLEWGWDYLINNWNSAVVGTIIFLIIIIGGIVWVTRGTPEKVKEAD